MIGLFENIFWICMSIISIGLLLVASIEIYIYIWNRISKLRKGRKNENCSNRT